MLKEVRSMRCLLLSLMLLSIAQPVMAQTTIFPPAWQQIRQDYADKAVIERLYQAFQKQDGAAMAACYHPDATFSDPVFPNLKGKEIGAMWQMLLAASEGKLKVRYGHTDVQAGQGKALWIADYIFSATGLPVHNVISAKFTFKDGLIYTHQDSFDLHRWSSMALGLPGSLLGHTPIVQNTLRTQAGARLKEWIQAHP